MSPAPRDGKNKRRRPAMVRVRRGPLGGYVITAYFYSTLWNEWVTRFGVTDDTLAKAVASFREMIRAFHRLDRIEARIQRARGGRFL